MTQREDVIKFEQGRIREMKEERMEIKKKKLKKWMKYLLIKERMEVEEMLKEIEDGKMMLKMMEII
jgi:spectrin beta